MQKINDKRERNNDNNWHGTGMVYKMSYSIMEAILYFSREHLPYAIPAIFMLIIVVIPLPLVLFFDPFLLKIEGHLVQQKPCLKWTLKFKPFLILFKDVLEMILVHFAGLFFFYRVVIYYCNQ